jgi:hypothetical protein
MTATTFRNPEHDPAQQQLIDRAVRALSVPRAEPADSFVLHAPLNLMARVGLLDYVAPDAVPAAEAVIQGVVDRYESVDPAAPPIGSVQFDNVGQAAARLTAALHAGDLDHVDEIAIWLTARASSAELGRLLGESIIDSLAAAGHAPIGFHLLQRVRGGRLDPALLRGPLREIGRHPDRKIHWFRHLQDAQDAQDATPLETAIGSLPYIGRPDSDFIFPLMSQLEASGVAPRAIGPALSTSPDLSHTARTLARAAALHMLHGDAAHAPYGWSHCLTMPQGALALAGRGVAARTSVAVAATFFAGFHVAYEHEPIVSLADDAVQDHVPSDTGEPNQTALATFAALHHDEHLAKYTLACLHAANDDPSWRAVYLRAAAHLADWWKRQPTAA